MHPLHDIGHIQLVVLVEARDPDPVLVTEAQSLHTVESHADTGVPAHHVGDRHRALDHRADGVAHSDVLPPPGLTAPGAFAGVLRLDRVDLVVGVRPQLQRVVLLAGAGLGPLGADHEPILRRERGAVDLAEHLGHPLVDGAPGELARLLQHAHQRVTPAELPVRSQR